MLESISKRSFLFTLFQPATLPKNLVKGIFLYFTTYFLRHIFKKIGGSCYILRMKNIGVQQMQDIEFSIEFGIQQNIGVLI